jgi:hypothetical protein
MQVYVPRKARFPKRVQLKMLDFYLAAQKRASTYFLFPADLSDEAKERFLREVIQFQEHYGIDAELLVSSLEAWGYNPPERIVEALREAEKEQGRRLSSFLREQARRTEEVHALHPPIQIIPKSLRPIESLAR